MADTVTISNSHESELQFDVSVEGTDVSEMRVRFVIAGPKGANYSFNCKQSDEAGKWAVTIPPMPHLPVGKYDFTVEVITNGYYFDPYKGTIEVTPKPAVSTSSKKPSAPTVKVSASTPTKKEEDAEEDVSWTAPVISEEDEAKKKADDLVAAFMKSREQKAPLTEKEKAIKDALKDFKKNRPPKREAPKAPPKKKVEEKVVEEKQDAPAPVVQRRSNLASVIEKLDEPKDEQARKIHEIIKGQQ